MQTGNERKASSWDGTEVDVSDPEQYQKEETYVALLRVTVRSLRAAFPFLIIGRACQHHYLLSHIPLESFQLVGFKVWNSGRTCIGPPVAVPVYKFSSTLICWLLWYEVWGSFIRWEEVKLKRQEVFQYYIKKQDKNMLRTSLRMPNATLRFWFKTDTIPQSGANRSHVSAQEEQAGLSCSGLCNTQPSCEFYTAQHHEGRSPVPARQITGPNQSD